MHASDHHDPLSTVEAWLRDHRSLIASRLEEAMSHLEDLIANGRKLAAERADLIADRDAQKDRADKAEALAAERQAKIDSDDKMAADASDELASEVAKESGLGKADAQKPADPVVTTAPSGASVTVAPTADGVTVHTDPAGIVTTLDHATGDATAVDPQGITVTPAPIAVAEAKDAAAAAGVTVGG